MMIDEQPYFSGRIVEKYVSAQRSSTSRYDLCAAAITRGTLMSTSALASQAKRPLVILVQFFVVIAILATLYVWVSPADEAQANQAEFEEALNRINTYRSWIGIDPLRMDSSLMEAAQSHADYWALNAGNMPGLHNQTPGAPGYSGETMRDRANNFGYTGSINENVGLSGSMLSTVDWSIATINHRLTLIDPRYTDIGFGAVTTDNGGMETIKIGTRSWSNTADPNWQAWPVDGTQNIGLSYLGSAPSPFANVPYPVGYPITLKYHGDADVQFHSATLSANGSDVSILAEVGHGWLTDRTMMILATDPLQPDTQYQVTVDTAVNGEPLTHSWSFQTGSSNSSRPTHDGTPPSPPPASQPQAEPDPEPEVGLPEGLERANPAFQQTWADADQPVYQDELDRTWLWGPDTFHIQAEKYLDSPAGERDVAYFDKSRMEINDPDAEHSSPWYVTNGLLVRDMISGAVQVGDHEFEQREPAQIAIAGDNLLINPDAPTYGSLRPHSAALDENRQPDRTGEAVKTQITARGRVIHGPEMPDGVSYTYYDDVTGFNIADVFWNQFSSADHYDWIYAVGHPITDPHWAYTSVDGVDQWVLIQAFQRRLLTYTPGNAAGWQIEMGNVGRHYFDWRYGEAPPH
jgi:uncharacterized protein YkwD